MSLSQRSVRSVKWNTVATIMGFPVGFIQTVLLARLLPVEYFGVFAAVTSIIGLSSIFFEFGLSNAFIHRSPETEDEQKAVAVFFTLYLALNTIWLIVMVAYGSLALAGLQRYVLIPMVFANFLTRITNPPRVLLIRRVQHRRLAVLDLITGVSSAIISISIAWFTRSIWALMISTVLTLLWSVLGLYVWKPVWKPRLAWDPSVVRYYFSFGARSLVNNVADGILDNSDNLWTSRYLGNVILGYYSRAFKFAIYPRILLSTPVNQVALGTYAELKYDRQRMSKAFFQTNFFLSRAGFLIAGCLVVIAPNFIRLLIGARWLPMLDAFRLMLVFALLDPIKVTISGVLMAVGKPERITIVRFAQITTLIVGLFVLGIRYEISGVALAMDLMIIVGTVLLLIFVRPFVDFSLWRLFGLPVIGLLVGFVIYGLVYNLIPVHLSDWLAIIIKTGLFCLGYLSVLFLLEREQLLQAIRQVINLPT